MDPDKAQLAALGNRKDLSDRERMTKDIETYVEQFARTCRRPDLGDVTMRKLFAAELAGKIARA